MKLSWWIKTNFSGVSLHVRLLKKYNLASNQLEWKLYTKAPQDCADFFSVVSINFCLPLFHFVLVHFLMPFPTKLFFSVSTLTACYENMLAEKLFVHILRLFPWFLINRKGSFRKFCMRSFLHISFGWIKLLGQTFHKQISSAGLYTQIIPLPKRFLFAF